MRAVELFAGAGGMSLGLRNAGFELVQAYDSWLPAVETHRRNIGAHIWQHDLKDIFGIGPMLAQLAPDLIAGGPPCQDYSLGGKRKEGENAGMTRAFAMLVCIARPNWFLMENVGAAAKSRAWSEARVMLTRAGYGLTEAKLNASWYGVPQNRKRLFVVGRLGERDGFLASALTAARTERQTVMADVLKIDREYIYSRPFRDGRGVRSIHEPFPTLTRTAWERPTDRYLSKPNLADPVPASQAHVLSRDELAQIQGFPAGWEWPAGTRQDIYQMIANAVPAPLAEAIGRVILARENGESIPAVQGNFVRWLMQRGHTNQVARNTKAQLNKARRLLRGRTFKDTGLEVLALEAVPEFRAIDRKMKSNLRAAVRLYAEFSHFGMQPAKPLLLDLAA